MERSAGPARAVRTSAATLAELSRITQNEFGELARRSHDDVAQVAGIVGRTVRPYGGEVTAALGELATEMASILDDARDQISAAVAAEADSLNALLTPAGGGTPLDATAAATPDTATVPPLPDLSDIAAGKGTREWAEAVVERYPRLTADEVLAIHEYTTVRGVDRINGYLRDPASVPEDEHEELDRLIAHAVSGLSKLPKRPGVTFRGTGLPDEVLEQWWPRRRVKDPAFTSSSVKIPVAETFRRGRNAFITIIGWTGVDVQQLSCFGHEAEILFKPNTELRVLSRAWDDQHQCYRLEAEEVPA